ncbi:uncharacterized protein HMPREF1541_02094 [Cyphellophora europaea CBS 101466]|uniref:F-box domain-containing protein n=1 Tax=Cyphellophora europaea (strain CBS 101466) TaxID=1220924 RepID=W2S2K9_CYPE1|nr:uncharacterized protein HMPREF1541_02094 [Cyphellophora europaea CBS 101466]ETN42936.1 hypothetical protein HMPREF1541_02094 [Cyphellophora europaea CBS 101466]
MSAVANHAPGKERKGSIFKLFGKHKKERAQSVAPDDGHSHRSSVSQTPRRSLQISSKDAYIIEQRSTNASSLSGGSSLAAVSTPYQRDKQTGETKYVRDTQTGEIIDHTEMLHSLGLVDSAKEVPLLMRIQSQDGTEPGEKIVARLEAKIWDSIHTYLSLADVAALSFSCKAFHQRLGDSPFTDLNLSDNKDEKDDFLIRLDKTLPAHLLCFDCQKYHKRLNPGEEKLMPVNVLNPVYTCPELGNPNKIYPRIRLTFDRILPLTFLQLAMRAHRFAPQYGITTESLFRRYKDKVDDSTWSHQTKFVVVKGHLLMRVMSQCYAPPGLPPAGERHLLYSRQNFIPFFSVCPHWQDGVLMTNVKCALRHIPKPLEGSGINRIANEAKLHFNPHNPIISLCNECRPMRRCPECPSEYLIEVRMTEDRSDPSKLFKQTLVVTRWTDLGDGTSPYTPEWAALNGRPGFDSIQALGKRAVAGQFEAEFNGDVLPSQNMLSMNPEKVKLGERGHDWY